MLQEKVVEVLLVEDDLDSAYLTVTAAEMGKTPFHVNTAFDGIDGLEYLRRQGRYQNASRPDLILLDLNMPRMSGEEMLKEIKKDSDLQSIPVVILTASDRHHELKKSHHLPEECYQLKPSQFKDYIDLMKSLADFFRKGKL